MKRFFLYMVYTISLSVFYANTHALAPENFTYAIERKIEKIQNIEQKVEFLQDLSTLLTKNKYTQWENSDFFDAIRKYSLVLLENIKDSIDINLLTQLESTSTKKLLDLPSISDNFSNIDEQKVRNAILSWHNDERKSLWRSLYVYNLDLEWSATTRANKLSISGKTSNLHPRKSWDWYYNYDSMLERFSDLWINFPRSIGWNPSFSESIWYNVYKCSKSDCTDDLINAIKKTRTWLIMKEKTSNGSHYRAATMKHFTQMWAWIAINKSNNRYYLVIHYGIEI